MQIKLEWSPKYLLTAAVLWNWVKKRISHFTVTEAFVRLGILPFGLAPVQDKVIWPWGFCTNNGDKFATRGFLKSSKLERGGCWNAFAWWLWTCEYTHNFLFTWHKSDPLPQQVALREKYPCPCGKYLVPWTCPCFLYMWCLLKLERDDKEKSNAEA